MSEGGESEMDSLSESAEDDKDVEGDGEMDLDYKHNKEDLYVVDPFMVRREATLL
jgi:ATP-dependent RNA helicase DDX27